MLNISDTDCSLDIATRPRNTSTLRKPPKIAGEYRKKPGESRVKGADKFPDGG